MPSSNGSSEAAAAAQAIGPGVTVVAPRLGIGGTERHLLRVLPELRRRGLDVSLFLLERGGGLEHEIEARGVPVHGGPSGGGIVNSITAFFALLAELRRRPADMIHFVLPKAYILGTLAAVLLGRKRLMMSRRSLANYRFRRPLLSRLEGLCYRRTRIMLGNSIAVVNELRAEAGDPAKVGLIHNGVVPLAAGSAEGRATMRRLLRIEDSACVIASVANLIVYKGHADLLAALGDLQDQLPQPWRLVLIGRDEGIGAALEETAERLGIGGHILWLGERTDVETLLDGVDIAVLASHEEGFSNALLETMGKEIATVATAVGGNVDAIEDGVSGLLVAPRAPAELGAAILKLARAPDLRRRIAAAARARVEREFSLERCVDRHENLYRGFERVGRQPLQQIIDGAV